MGCRPKVGKTTRNLTTFSSGDGFGSFFSTRFELIRENKTGALRTVETDAIEKGNIRLLFSVKFKDSYMDRRHFWHSSQHYTRTMLFHAVKIIITTHQTARCHINESWIISIDNHSQKSLDGFSRRRRRDTTIHEPYPSKFEQLKRAHNANTDNLATMRAIFLSVKQ